MLSSLINVWHDNWLSLYGRLLNDSRDSIREMTPFMEAAAAGHEIIVQYFLQHVSF